MSTHLPAILPGAVDIHPGEHPTGHFLGMTWNLDTIWVTVVAGLVVCLLGLWARNQLTKQTPDGVPTKLQLVWETIISQVQTQVEDNLGKINPYVVPLAVALFFFILIANWLEVIPTEPNKHIHLLPSPTADTNLTYAMAAIAMVSVWVYGVRTRGLGAYLKHFVGASIFPDKKFVDLLIRTVFTFLEVLQDLLKPITLALRLFGNIFAGGIMIALIGSLVQWLPVNLPVGGVLAVVFGVIWKLFDTLFLGGIQAFIFALLTVLYFGMAGAGHDEHSENSEESQHESPELAA
ncbi:MAG TPA: F0F1 ATP synthase subunit A [Nocardioides sp.]|uniref:F0F1 ATP synthase subunit A n=1 Tax=Nocardioides sp. TaxID=35761 RepID=UPI002E35A5AF|nr:F0F1 ATP synthase subunit A [Nocardioides sp.]HEX3931776.1 F0F1 ATP synthase subunit A [Nocardioides sp.]